MKWLKDFVAKIKAWWAERNKPEPKPPVVVVDPPVPVPTPDPTPTPQPGPVGDWRGCLFTPATAYENSHDNAASQMSYRSCNGEPNENLKRMAMIEAVYKLGGNVLSYIIGNAHRGRIALDGCLCGRIMPDGKYWPDRAPTEKTGECDWAMWAKRTYGISHHLAWIWNDDGSMPITEATVKAAVAMYDRTRLGIESVAFGTCLEFNEICPDPKLAAQALKWIKKYAPNSRAVNGSSNADYLIATAALAPAGCYCWLEAEANGNPITDSCTIANINERLMNKAARVAAKVGAEWVICGEHWSRDSATRRAVTKIIEALGYEDGSGEWTKMQAGPMNQPGNYYASMHTIAPGLTVLGYGVQRLRRRMGMALDTQVEC